MTAYAVKMYDVSIILGAVLEWRKLTQGARAKLAAAAYVMFTKNGASRAAASATARETKLQNAGQVTARETKLQNARRAKRYSVHPVIIETGSVKTGCGTPANDY